MSSIEDLKYAGTVKLIGAAARRLHPFLAICLGCGSERELNMDDEIPICECGVRRWGVAGCNHCRAALAKETQE